MKQQQEHTHKLIERFGKLVRDAVIECYIRRNRHHDSEEWRSAQPLLEGHYQALAAELLRMGVTPPPLDWRIADAEPRGAQEDAAALDSPGPGRGGGAVRASHGQGGPQLAGDGGAVTGPAPARQRRGAARGVTRQPGAAADGADAGQ